MRSKTLSDLPGRCARCWIRHEFCLCAALPTVQTKTHLVLVRHERESWKSTGTARVASLALPNLSLVDYGEDFRPAQDALSGASIEGAWLLFPTDPEGPRYPQPTGPVRKLIILDGTWRQTRRMLRRLPSLETLPRLSLPPKEEPPLRLRESPSAEGRSTLEAVADALRVLEGPEVADPLDRLHALMVERVFRARGVWELKSGL